MPFPWTLQRYIFREMGKTFLLTAAALTGVLGLGGGVLEMIKLGEITPGQLGSLMLLVLPVAAALTLPIAALFSAAATYGRLSADNEFVACRSGGINMHVLFLPALVLSIASALVTFAFSNFLIPGMVRNLNAFVTSDFGSLVQQRLDRPRGITLGGRFRIYADECSVDPVNSNRVILKGIAFVEVDGEEWVRYGTAQEVVLDFSKDTQPPQVKGMLLGLSFYDRRARRFFEEAKRILPPNDIPSTLSLKFKFLTLGELFHYWNNPGEWRAVRDKMERLRLAIGQNRIFLELWDEWLDNDRRIVLADGDRRLVITSQLGAPLSDGTGIELHDVRIEESGGGGVQTATAARAILEVARGRTLAQSGIQVEAYEVTIDRGTTRLQKPKATFGPVTIRSDLVAQILDMSDQALLDPGAGSQLDNPVGQRRHEASSARIRTIHEIVGTLNERLAFSISVVVLVLLGATLGIVFRGSHVMVAFGISFVPSLVIIIGIVMGKQMSYNAPTHALGIGMMWTGIVLVAALDFYALTRLLRR